MNYKWGAALYSGILSGWIETLLMLVLLETLLSAMEIELVQRNLKHT